MQNEKHEVKCPRCGNVTDDFYWYDNYTRRSAYCKECMKDHRKENTLKKSEEARYNARNKELLEEGLRACKVCGEIKELSEFTLINKKYYLTTCKECSKKKARRK